MAGIYVHFPFCTSRCIYCDFYSRVRKDFPEYVDALIREAENRKRDSLDAYESYKKYIADAIRTLRDLELPL